MIRILIKLALTIAGNALGLIIADLILSDMSLTASGFLMALLIFTVVEVLVQPLMTKMAMQNAEALQGGTALVSTFIALLVTVLVTDSLTIDGTTTWILATLIVWLVTMLAGVILPLIFLKKVVEERR